jgi:hypothetical protein
MKKLFLFMAFVSIGLITFAQQVNDYMEVTRAALKTEKKAMIAEVMNLTPEETEPFWAMYNEFQGKLYTANTKYLKIINEFAENYENMSGEKANDLMKRLFAYDAEILKLKKTYFKKFQGILSPQKTLMYFQAENKIDMLIDYELAASIPLLDARDSKKEPKK